MDECVKIKKPQVLTAEYFLHILKDYDEPIYYERLRGYVSSASEEIKSYVKKKCRAENLLMFFKRRSFMFIVDRENCVESKLKNNIKKPKIVEDSVAEVPVPVVEKKNNDRRMKQKKKEIYSQNKPYVHEVPESGRHNVFAFDSTSSSNNLDFDLQVDEEEQAKERNLKDSTLQYFKTCFTSNVRSYVDLSYYDLPRCVKEYLKLRYPTDKIHRFLLDNYKIFHIDDNNIVSVIEYAKTNDLSANTTNDDEIIISSDMNIGNLVTNIVLVDKKENSKCQNIPSSNIKITTTVDSENCNIISNKTEKCTNINRELQDIPFSSVENIDFLKFDKIINDTQNYNELQKIVVKINNEYKATVVDDKLCADTNLISSKTQTKSASVDDDDFILKPREQYTWKFENLRKRQIELIVSDNHGNCNSKNELLLGENSYSNFEDDCHTELLLNKGERVVEDTKNNKTKIEWFDGLVSFNTIEDTKNTLLEKEMSEVLKGKKFNNVIKNKNSETCCAKTKKIVDELLTIKYFVGILEPQKNEPKLIERIRGHLSQASKNITDYIKLNFKGAHFKMFFVNHQKFFYVAKKEIKLSKNYLHHLSELEGFVTEQKKLHDLECKQPQIVSEISASSDTFENNMAEIINETSNSFIENKSKGINLECDNFSNKHSQLLYNLEIDNNLVDNGKNDDNSVGNGKAVGIVDSHDIVNISQNPKNSALVINEQISLEENDEISDTSYLEVIDYNVTTEFSSDNNSNRDIELNSEEENNENIYSISETEKAIKQIMDNFAANRITDFSDSKNYKSDEEGSGTFLDLLSHVNSNAIKNSNQVIGELPETLIIGEFSKNTFVEDNFDDSKNSESNSGKSTSKLCNSLKSNVTCFTIYDRNYECVEQDMILRDFPNCFQRFVCRYFENKLNSKFVSINDNINIINNGSQTIDFKNENNIFIDRNFKNLSQQDVMNMENDNYEELVKLNLKLRDRSTFSNMNSQLHNEISDCASISIEENVNDKSKLPNFSTENYLGDIDNDVEKISNCIPTPSVHRSVRNISVSSFDDNIKDINKQSKDVKNTIEKQANEALDINVNAKTDNIESLSENSERSFCDTKDEFIFNTSENTRDSICNEHNDSYLISTSLHSSLDSISDVEKGLDQDNNNSGKTLPLVSSALEENYVATSLSQNSQSNSLEEIDSQNDEHFMKNGNMTDFCGHIILITKDAIIAKNLENGLPMYCLRDSFLCIKHNLISDRCFIDLKIGDIVCCTVLLPPSNVHIFTCVQFRLSSEEGISTSETFQSVSHHIESASNAETLFKMQHCDKACQTFFLM